MNLYFCRRAYPALDLGFLPRVALATVAGALAGVAGLTISEPTAALLALSAFISLVLVTRLVSVGEIRATVARGSRDLGS